MSTPSNLYAEKIYAEQPTALWSLDDECSFVSYFSQAHKQIANWTPTGTDALSVFPYGTPYPVLKTEQTALISGDGAASPGSENTITLTSPSTFSSTLDSFTVGFYFYSYTSSIKTVSISYTGSEEQVFTINSFDVWQHISATFPATVSSKSLIIKIKYNTQLVGGDTYNFLINGFSIGNRSENFNTTVTGLQLESIPATIATTQTHGIKAYAYGSDVSLGYYIGNNTSKKLYATNASIPMVFGANTSTVLFENTTGPSLIVPGFGFLNDSGRYQTTVFEAWLRINSKASVPRRILGPIASTDGIYVDGPFITLKVGTYSKSHFVGEWFRPMLLQVEYGDTFTNLILNGEQVVSIRTVTKDLNLASKYSEAGKDQDYIGFYAYSDVPTVEVDCVAIYPYRVAPVVAKRRFAYGQAVQPPQNLSTAYDGTQVFFDYTFAGYSANHSYPDLEKWGSAIKDNVYTSKTTLSSPKHEIPSIVINEGTVTDWELDLFAANAADSDTNPYIKFRPSSDWSNTSGYAYLPKLRLGGTDTPSAIYGVFRKLTDDIDNEQTLFRLEDPVKKDHVSATLDGKKLSYKYKINGKSGVIVSSENLSTGDTTFIAGFDLYKLSEYSRISGNGLVFNFLKNLNNLSLFIGGDYVGNDPEISTTFLGKLYTFSIMSKNTFYTSSIYTEFLENGTFNQASSLDTQDFIDVHASYSFGLKKKVYGEESYFLDMSAKSFWQDYIPVSKLCKTATGTVGEEIYGIDFIQLNVDYPVSKLLDGSNIDTSLDFVKTYVVFHYSDELINDYGLSRSAVKLSKSKVLTPGSGWNSTDKYEVVDGTVIYMPTLDPGKTIEDLIMTTVIEIFSNGIDHDPINIRFLQYASQTFNKKTSTSFNKDIAKPIHTRLGTPVYPYTIDGGLYKYDQKNPFAISKTSSPYLYLTEKSGIKVLDSFGSDSERGLLLPVNEDAYQYHNISSISTTFIFNDSEVPSSSMDLFEIYGKTGTIKVTLSRIDSSISNRGIIKAKVLKDGSWVDYSSVVFYVNGKAVTTPIVSVNEWVSLGLLFTETISFSNFIGSIEFLGSILVNNFSYYQVDASIISQQVVTKTWNQVLYKVGGQYTWGDYTLPQLQWNNLQFLFGIVVPQITPDVVYSIYTGTNKLIANDSADVSGVQFGAYQYSIYNDVLSQTSSVSAV